MTLIPPLHAPLLLRALVIAAGFVPGLAAAQHSSPPVAAAAVLAPGDSTTGEFTSAAQEDTITLALTAGDAVDVGAFGRTTNVGPLTLKILDDRGVEVGQRRVARYRPNSGQIAPGVSVPRTGSYRVIVGVPEGSFSYYCPCRYAVHTRSAGPVLELVGWATAWDAAEGSGPLLPDAEYRILNQGTGSATFTVRMDSAGGWLTPSRVSGTVFAPPPGSAPSPLVVRMSANASGLSRGFRLAEFRFELPDDVWNGTEERYATLYLHDPRATVLSTSIYTQSSRAAVAPDGRLVVTGDRTLERVDPASGAHTTWVRGLNQYLGGISFGPDSALYLADRVGRRVLRVSPGGAVSTLFDAPGEALDVEVLPDGTVVALVDEKIMRRTPSGVLTTLVATQPGSTMSLAYSRGWIYYAAYGTLRRVSPYTGQDEERGRLPTAPFALVWELAAGESGRLYATDVSVKVVDDSGAEVERLWPPSGVIALAVGDGALYGMSGAFKVWKMPLEDRAPRNQALVGDANADGQVTSADALGVLSYVVGRPVPAGWNVPLLGDADCDGEVTAVDALVILSQAVGKDVSAFCVGGRR